MIFMTEAVTGLELARGDVSVELCRPHDVSTAWVTRKSGKGETFDVAGNTDKIVAARIAWSSWSPGYMNGIYINNVRFLTMRGRITSIMLIGSILIRSMFSNVVRISFIPV